MKKLIVYGAAIHFIKELEYYDMEMPAAVTLDKEYIKEKEVCGIKVVEFETIERIFSPEEYDMIVFGPVTMRLRKVMYDKAKAKGYTLRNYISPGAFVSRDIDMGDNVVVFRGADLGFCGTMGSDIVVRQKVYLGHEFNLKSHIVISPGCTIGGGCGIGDFCWIGLGATVRSGRKIGDDVLVGAGAVVTKDVESGVTVIGCPAKVVARHDETGVDLHRKEMMTK